MYDWQKKLKLKDGLKEEDIEKFEGVLLNLPRMALTNTAMASRLKAAIVAGWIVEPASEHGEFGKETRYFYDGKNVNEIHPGAIRWLGKQIDEHYQTAVEIPKNL